MADKHIHLGGIPVIFDQSGAVVTCEQSLCTGHWLMETVSFVQNIARIPESHA